jgi:serine/threonine-protein kinase
MATLPPLQGQIELGEELGRGAFGVVHRGRLADGRVVAVKLHGAMPAEEEARVQREADLLSGLRHPRLVAFHGLFRGPQGELALVYELVDGVELEARLTEGPLTLVETLAVCTGIAQGLDALHQVGLVHRDLKPGNVMLGPDGAPRLIDYGMLRPTEAGRTLTATGAVVGTPAYMAPEQISGVGRPTPALDQYALGCVVFECLAGLPPFEGDLSAILDGHLKRPPPRLRERAPHLPLGLQAVLERMLAKSPEERFGSCGEAMRALDAARHHVGPVSEATQVVTDGDATATRPLASPAPGERVETTAPLPEPTPALAPPSGSASLVPRFALAALVAGGIAVGFLRDPGGSAPALTSAPTPEAAPATAEAEFPPAPAFPKYPRSSRILEGQELRWASWNPTSRDSSLYEAAVDEGHDVLVEAAPVPVGPDLLGVTTNRGGVVLLERASLGAADDPSGPRRIRERASWRLEPLPHYYDGHVRDGWFTPFLVPAPEDSLWLTASSLHDPPATLRLVPGSGVRGHSAPRLRPSAPTEGSAWRAARSYPQLSLADGDGRVRIEGIWPARDGSAWVGPADTLNHSSWISEGGAEPRPISLVSVTTELFSELEQIPPDVHLSPREIPMRPFFAGGGWVRGGALLLKASSRLPDERHDAAQGWVSNLSGAVASSRGHASFSVFSAEPAGSPEGPAPRKWVLPLPGYPEAYPYPFEGGFLMMYRGRLLHFPEDALEGTVSTSSGRELDTYPRLWLEERFQYPAATMTYDRRTGLDVLVWENLRFRFGKDEPQEVVWYRYPDLRVDPSVPGGVHLGARRKVASWSVDQEAMGIPEEMTLMYDGMSPIDFVDHVKHPGMRMDQRLPGGRLWVIGLTCTDTVSRLLVLDLAVPKVVGTYGTGGDKAIVAGPVLYRGNVPGAWEVYLSDRGGWVFGTRLLGTRPEDG